jgi:ribokinase
MKTPCVVVVGSTMIDMITYAKKLPERGQTVQGENFALGFGGKGANQAVMAARLGAKVYMVNTLGDDVFGDSTIKNFADEGIDTTHIARTSGPSGVAPIWVEPDGTNRIICVPGANNSMSPSQAQSAIQEISRSSEIDVVIGQLEIPQAVTAAAFRAARQRGIPTILNPAPSAPLSVELLQASDWIIPNESEFADMHPQGLAPITDEVIVQLSQLLKKKIVVTLGEAGAAYCDNKGHVLRISARQVMPKDTTGAGDAFVGAFAFGLASTFNEVHSIMLGCNCASDSVTKFGTQSSYPNHKRALEIVAELIDVEHH